MRIVLLIGMDAWAIGRIASVLEDKRGQMAGKGVLFPRAAGAKNHTRLFMAVTEPANVDRLRFNRGVIAPEAQADLRRQVEQGLAREVAEARPELMILLAEQLGPALAAPAEMERLRAVLAPLSPEIEVIALVEEQARALAWHYAEQVFEGRAAPLSRELALAGAESWWDACLAARPVPDPARGLFAEVQGAPFWLDYARLVAEWEAVFGAGRVHLHGLDRAALAGADAPDAIRALLGVTPTLGKAAPVSLPALPPAPWLARARAFNEILLRYIEVKQAIVPRQLWRRLLAEMEIGGPAIDPGGLAAVSRRFAPANAALADAHPGLGALCPPPEAAPWQEADPRNGFRASQYLLAFRGRIDRATREERRAKAAALTRPEAPDEPEGLSPVARRIMPPLARQNFDRLRGGPFAPHNRLGRVNEEELAAAFTPVPPRPLAEGSTGRVIVGCMKNEAPYIVEWVAYHRAIGVDTFLIYTNGCEDGTDAILDRLQAMGVLEHRNNDDWKGNSPQQHALNRALKEPVIRNAEWIIHIDVDEFINIRCGNGTLDDFLARAPDATNVAMTWRLFGNNGITALTDGLVIEQFDACAPRYCPKPHTVWGFKTMFRNIGAYEKISCHRPNKLAPGFERRVKWVNGSGQDMTQEAIRNGWRNSKKSIGYDLLQLNHYALRSAESFLIKRQRGRALHVDRSIGLNYWIRMDWSESRDITIQRNLPRLRSEIARLLQDETLARLHQEGHAWHRAKAAELRANPEFAELYDRALELKLTETERVAYALALDM
ncbi:MAG: glycosyltransferase family 2 protein, partial [Paracoccaceae bacterium]